MCFCLNNPNCLNCTRICIPLVWTSLLVGPCPFMCEKHIHCFFLVVAASSNCICWRFRPWDVTRSRMHFCMGTVTGAGMQCRFYSEKNIFAVFFIHCLHSHNYCPSFCLGSWINRPQSSKTKGVIRGSLPSLHAGPPPDCLTNSQKKALPMFGANGAASSTCTFNGSGPGDATRSRAPAFPTALLPVNI